MLKLLLDRYKISLPPDTSQLFRSASCTKRIDVLDFLLKEKNLPPPTVASLYVWPCVLEWRQKQTGEPITHLSFSQLQELLVLFRFYAWWERADLKSLHDDLHYLYKISPQSVTDAALTTSNVFPPSVWRLFAQHIQELPVWHLLVSIDSASFFALEVVQFLMEECGLHNTSVRLQEEVRSDVWSYLISRKKLDSSSK